MPVCLYVCMSDNITFESLDVGGGHLHIRCISMEYGSSSYMKVIWSKSRSQQHKMSQMPVYALINFRRQFSLVLARWRRGWSGRLEGVCANYTWICKNLGFLAFIAF